MINCNYLLNTVFKEFSSNVIQLNFNFTKYLD